MGAGRKTQTFTLPEKSVQDKHETHWTIINNCPSFRNLKTSELGGVIFGCKNNTMNECLHRKLFGLPSPHFSYVKNIGPGLPLFLFNYSDKTLHGIYEAASDGHMRIQPDAWIGNEFETTPYPAQVRIRVQTQCQPLSDKQFGEIIKTNYCDQKHFYFELDRAQTEKLISLFMSFTMTASTSAPHKNVNMDPKLKAKAVSEGGKKEVGIPLKASNIAYSDRDKNVNASSQGDPSSDLARHMAVMVLDGEEKEVKQGNSGPTKWSSLFSGPNTSDTVKKSRDMSPSVPEIPLPPTSGNAAWGWVSPRFDPHFDDGVTSVKDSKGDSENNQGHLGMRKNDEALNSYNPVVGSTSCNQRAPRTNSNGSSEVGKENAITDVEPDSFDDEDSDCSSEDFDGENNSQEVSATEVAWEGADKPTNGFKSQTETNNNNVKDFFPQEKAKLKETESSNIYSIDQLVGEVDRLITSHLKQTEKIHSLEHDVVKSKFEIQHLKDKWKAFECQSIKNIGILEEEPKLKNDPSDQRLDGSIFVVGGHDNSTWLKATELYNPCLDHKEPCCPMRIILPHSSATKLKDEIYVLGGGCNQVWHDEVESYNPYSNNWTSFSPLRRKKGNLASVSFNDKIYAIGGGNGSECFSEVDMYLLDIGKWISSSSMIQERISHGAVEINGAIYVAGGCDKKGYLSSVERFDPRERKWTKLESMPTNRGCHSLVVLNEKLYAMGGYDGNSAVSTVDIFDPRRGSWTTGEPMINCRAYATSAVIGDKIYALGGMKSDRKFVTTVECYKEDYGWQATSLKGIGKRLCFSAIVI